MRLLDIVQGKLVIPQMLARNKWDAIEELVDKLVAEHEIRIFDRREVLEAVVARERSRSTGLEQQVAMPHGRSRAVEDLLGVLGIAPDGIPFESTDGADAQVICLLVIPELQHRDHIKTISDLARLLTESSFREQLVAAGRTGSHQNVLQSVEQREGPDFLQGW